MSYFFAKTVSLSVFLGLFLGSQVFADPTPTPSPIPSPTPTLEQSFEIAAQEMNTLYKNQYGLYPWKAARYGWNSDREAKSLIKRARAMGSSLTLLKAQRLLKEFVESTRDVHGNVLFRGQPHLNLPIGIHSSRGRVFVTYVDTSTYIGPIQVGDELISFDGQPAFDAIRSMFYVYPNSYTVDLGDATRRLVDRYVMLGDPMPASPTVNLQLYSPVQGNYSAELTWPGYPKPASKELNPRALRRSVQPGSHMPSILVGHNDNPYGFSSVKSYFPKAPTISFESAPTDLFYAWIGATDSGTRVGMIRIPSFDVDDFGASIAAFGALVEKMQNNTDILVLDTQGNGGGVAEYDNAIYSYFTENPVPTPKFAYRLFPALVDAFKQQVTDLSAVTTLDQAYAYFGGTTSYGYPVTMQYVKEVLKTSVDTVQYAATGAKYGKPHFYDIEYIQPATGTRYTKPVIVMVDGETASGGDTFAAMFQDLHRGLIVGTQTAGAGAFVGDWNTMSGTLGLKYMAVPIALEYRVSGKVLENNGVTPDITLQPQPADLFGAAGANPNSSQSRYAQRIFSIIDRYARKK